MLRILKRILRSIVIQMIRWYVILRVKFAKPITDVPTIVFVNINNYPDNFSKILKNLGISQDEVINVQDKWDILLKTPIYTLQQIKLADIVVSTGDSPVFSILSKKQRLIYLWHACGAFKQMGLDAKSYSSRVPNNIVVSSEGVRLHYAKAFGIESKNVVALGVPRTEVFNDKESLEQIKNKLLARYPFFNNKKIYLYAPTYRKEPFRSEVGFDFNMMSELLHEDEFLIYKQHPAIVVQSKKNPTISNFFSTHNIMSMDNENILDLTIICDVIMTDYSSAFFEAMLLDKPCVFCANDIDIYEKNYYINYREDLPGSIVEDGSAETVINALRQATIENPNYQKFKEFHLGACKGNISQRVTNFIKEVYHEQT